MTRTVLYIPPTPADTVRCLLEIEPGQRVLYYTGRSLVDDRRRCAIIDRTAAVAHTLRSKGRMILVQRPNNRGGKDHIAIGR